MMKFLSLKLWVLSTFLFLTPFATPLFAQDDDFSLEAESWGDDAMDDDPFLEEDLPDDPAAAPVSEAPAKKDAIKTEKAQPSSTSTAPSTSSTTATAPKPSHQSPPATSAPVTSKPKKVFKPIAPVTAGTQASGTVKRAGPPLLLIARPVYAPYSNETKTKYISAAAEAYFHFKLGALPGIQVVPYEKIANNIQYFRDFSRRISRTTYIEAAKKTGASYLFYSEYEPDGKTVKFATELYSITENKKISSSTSEVELSDFEDGLYDFVMEVGGALAGTIPQEVQKFLADPVMGKNIRKIETLGDAIVSTGEFTQKNAEKAAPEFEKMAKSRDLHLAKFFGALVLARAGNYTEAIDLQEQLKSSFGTEYPALSLQLAAYHRMAKSYDQALSAADDAAREPSLALVARIEKARIYEAQGNLDQAKREYESALSEGGEDGEVYFQLALVSIGLNNLSQAKNYLERAASAGRSLDKDDYFNLGLRYEALGTANDQAIEAYRNSLGLQQDNEEAWEKLAEIYSVSGQEAEAAECYVNLFQINNTAYRDYLVKAGIMFENAGYLENAKDAYSLFLARRFNDPQVNVRLAKLEMQGGNCKKAIELVDNMDTTGEYGSDITAINSQCGKEERRVVVPTDPNRKNWRGPFFWRVGSGAVTAAAIVLSFVVDSYVQKQIPVYEGARNTATVEQERAKLKSLEDKRKLCYLGVGVGMTSFALSIALPIVFSSN